MKRTTLLFTILFCALKCAFSQSTVDSSHFSDCDKIYQNFKNLHFERWDCTLIMSRRQIHGYILAVDCYRDNGNIDKGLGILLSNINSSDIQEIGYGNEWIEKLAELFTLKYGKKSVRKQSRKPSFNYYIDDIYSIFDAKHIQESDSTILNFVDTPVNYTVEFFGKEFRLLPTVKELKAEGKILSLKILKSEALPTEVENYCMKVWQNSTLYQELCNESKF